MRKRIFIATVAPFAVVVATILAACGVVDNWTLSAAKTPAAAPVYELRIQGAEPLPATPEFDPYQWDDSTTEGMEDV